MRHLIAGLAAFAAVSAISAPALAELEPGDTAPDFTVEGFQAGEAVSFHLAEALESGPVVVFFFPAAFTSGCEAQAASFADRILCLSGGRLVGDGTPADVLNADLLRQTYRVRADIHNVGPGILSVVPRSAI